jgi:hypothetical protein
MARSIGLMIVALSAVVTSRPEPRNEATSTCE